jgi:hypothetical protein
MPPGSSRVTIRLNRDAAGTRLHLQHEFADSSARDQHVPGWRFQLSLFGNVVANEAHADAATRIDAWFDAWTVEDEQKRQAKFASIAGPQIEFRDRYSLLSGLQDLNAHAGAALRFMPGVSLRRKGDVRQCQGAALADWTAPDSEGKERMSGTSMFAFGPDGRIESVTSFSNTPL